MGSHYKSSINKNKNETHSTRHHRLRRQLKGNARSDQCATRPRRVQQCRHMPAKLSTPVHVRRRHPRQRVHFSRSQVSNSRTRSRQLWAVLRREALLARIPPRLRLGRRHLCDSVPLGERLMLDWGQSSTRGCLSSRNERMLCSLYPRVSTTLWSDKKTHANPCMFEYAQCISETPLDIMPDHFCKKSMNLMEKVQLKTSIRKNDKKRNKKSKGQKSKTN